MGMETGELALLVRSLTAMARYERLSGDLAAARARLEEARIACTQPEITHSNHLAALFLEMGHVACAEQDWPQARHMIRQALAAPSRSAWETLAAIAAMAEVNWGEGDGATAARLLAFVVANTATDANTRQRAESLLQTLGQPATPSDASAGYTMKPLLTLEAACQLAMRNV